MNMLRRGLAWLADRQMKFSSEPVTYITGSGREFTISAVFGRSDSRKDEYAPFSFDSKMCDFLIRVSDLPDTPQVGDRIRTRGGLFEVLDDGDGCWRWSDPFRTLWRVHTRKISDGEEI